MHPMRDRQLGDRPTSPQMRLDQEPALVHRRPPPLGVSDVVTHPASACRRCPELSHHPLRAPCDDRSASVAYGVHSLWGRVMKKLGSICLTIGLMVGVLVVGTPGAAQA